MTDAIRRAGHGARSAPAAAVQALAPGEPAPVDAGLGATPGPSTRRELVRMAQEAVAHAALRGLPLRRCVLLSWALRHELPPGVTLPFDVAGAADGKQRVVAVPLPAAARPAPAGQAAQRARDFLAGQGVLAMALPLDRGYDIVRAVLEAAARELPDECLSHLTEALVLRQRRSDDGDALQAMLCRSVIDRVGGSRFRFAQGVELVAGLLRADAASEGRTGASIAAMARRAFSGSFASYLSVAAPGQLFDTVRVRSALAVLAAGAGGPRMAPQHLRTLLEVLPTLLRYAGPDDSHPIVPEDLAFVLARLCEVMGGATMPAPLREVVVAHVCSPKHAYPPPLRGAMVYQVGVALRLWEGPAARQQAWLSAIAGTAGLSPADVGTMAWALGLHLAGDPVAEGWHRTYEHIVEESTAPPPAVVAALVALAGREPLPAASRQGLLEGLRRVVPRDRLDEGGASLLGPTREPGADQRR